MKFNQYEKVLKESKPGRILLRSKHKYDILSGTIKEIDDCIYSHMMTVVGEDEILDILFPYSKIFKLTESLTRDNYKDYEIAVIDFNFTDEERELFIQKVRKREGTFYNVFQLIGFLLSYAHKKIFGKEIDNPLSLKEGLICTSVTRDLKKIDTRFDLSLLEESGDIDMVSPRDIHHAAISDKNDIFKLVYETKKTSHQ